MYETIVIVHKKMEASLLSLMLQNLRSQKVNKTQL